MYRARRFGLTVFMVAVLVSSYPLAAQTPSGAASAPAPPAPAATPAASTEDSGTTEAVFAPFPSRLRAAAEGRGIRLTWVDSPDVQGSYAVYRSVSSIGAADIDAAVRVGVVPPGVQTYTDLPPDSKPYFYAVLALAVDGSPYRIVIPLRNATVAPLAVLPAGAGPATAAAPAVVPQAAEGVDGLVARVQGDAVVLSYHPASPGMRLVAYRGAAEIEEPSDLLDAALISAFVDKDGRFADYPVPGIDYWYAILGEDDLKAGKIDLKPGHNSTQEAVQIATRPSAGGITALPPGARATPLPSFLMDRAPDAGAAPLPPASGPPPERQLAPETEKAVVALLASSPEPAPKIPALHILPEELASPTGGEDYALSLIVTSKLVAGDWSGGVDELRKYLSLNRSPAVAARARYYLGEALTHTGAYRDAFFELLSAQPGYTVETKPWVDFVLYRLRKS